YAIEPFATNGAGFVEDKKSVTIYALVYNPKKISKLSNESHKFYSYIYSLRRTLPFAIRWYTNIFSETLIEKILQELAFKGLLTKYPVLVEKNHGIVTQFEHTLVIDKQGNIIVTTDHC
ncbi:MAG: type II methionyl aminopeptidase, partial [Ignisphaera sp.]